MTRIQYLTGNIFDAETQVIVNTVNCTGTAPLLEKKLRKRDDAPKEKQISTPALFN